MSAIFTSILLSLAVFWACFVQTVLGWLGKFASSTTVFHASTIFSVWFCPWIHKIPTHNIPLISSYRAPLCIEAFPPSDQWSEVDVVVRLETALLGVEGQRLEQKGLSPRAGCGCSPPARERLPESFGALPPPLVLSNQLKPALPARAVCRS